ncbi:tyrosine-type recombinase/integrase [Fictibacillus sp. 23RED33]|uniref:site-specific integrase n=1 Tax=Fictibacillus sp. 23RED33 TaxID=2745879 RepID=UPI0018CD5F1C|nr:site-specific integrase [Fictibacillus sp. 23RED33]MBH0176252.1 tyrosine-type recombinase/integrase [Fictibacillus sp. 23RED33]
MGNEITPSTNLPISNALYDLVKDDLLDYLESNHADNTTRAYESDLKLFKDWCKVNVVQIIDDENNVITPVHPHVLIAYVHYLDRKKKFKISTITRKIASISQLHNEFESPVKDIQFQMVWKGLRRRVAKDREESHRIKPTQKKALSLQELLEFISHTDSSLKGLRDKALMLLGWATACRRSELVSLHLEDLEFTSKGLVVSLQHSKTNQMGNGEKKAVMYGKNPGTCPIRSVQKWIAAAKITHGPIFRPIGKGEKVKDIALSAHSVGHIVKEYAEICGYDKKDYGGHSLRRGLITTASEAGKDISSIKRQSGHKSDAMIYRYTEVTDLFKNNATEDIGL